MSAGHAQIVLRHLCRAVRPEGEAGDGELLDAFLTHRDEAAFAALLRRHGPMVWGVCRRLAGQRPDAEDAFQAVFLVLVRRGARVWPRERVGAWLHGVAFRVARKARRLADRRRAREKQVSDFSHPVSDEPKHDSELWRVVDEELRRLPERLRLPVLLCDVEGRPQRDAARQLQLPTGTLGHRLAAARSVLARRLARRGVTLSLAGLAAAAVPSSLSAVTRRAALTLATGRDLASLVPPQIVALIEGALIMSQSKFRLTAALTLVLLLGGLGLHTLPRSALSASENPPVKTAQPAAKPPAEAPADDRTFLRRLSLDLRNMEPTIVEMNYFLADRDSAKRRKVAAWMLESIDGWKKKTDAVDVQQRDDLKLRAYYDAQRTTRLQQYEEEFRRQTELKSAPPIQEAPKSPSNKKMEELLRHFYDELGRPSIPDGPTEAERANMLMQQFFDEATKPLAKPVTPPEALRYYDLTRPRDLNNPAPRPANDDDVNRTLQQYDKLLESLRQQQPPPAKPGDQPKVNDPEKNLGRNVRAEALLQRLLPGKSGSVTAGEKLAELSDIDRLVLQRWLAAASDAPSDAEFLRRLSVDVRGTLPTLLEMNYFVADKDGNKRQKLIEWMLSDPAVAKQMHEQWEKFFLGTTVRTGAAARPADRFDKLLDELLAARRGDDQVLEALTLATLARFPTESERLLLAVYLRAAPDRPAAWRQILATLTATQEFRSHTAEIHGRAKK